MKKTFPVNINGKVFYIDEDAYELLSNYLTQLRAAFCGTEGDEIVTDIESRISELFDERISAGANAITFADVNSVIEIMGKPADIGDMNDGITPPPPYSRDTDETNAENSVVKPSRKRLYRNLNNKVIGGVFGGLSTYLGWDANIMRLLYAALCIATYVWPLVLLYLIAWMIIPPANNPRRILESQGNPVTIDNIGQEVLSSTPPLGHEADNSSVTFVENAFRVLGKFLMGLIGLIGVAATLVATGFFAFFLVAFIASYGSGNDILINALDWDLDHCTSTLVPIVCSSACMAFSLCFIIPGVALAWTAGSVLFNYRKASKTTVIVAAIFETLIIVATVILMIYATHLTRFL